MDFVVIIALAAPCTALTGYVESRLILSWRTYLTQTLLAAYFSDRAFFNIKQVSAAFFRSRCCLFPDAVAAFFQMQGAAVLPGLQLCVCRAGLQGRASRRLTSGRPPACRLRRRPARGSLAWTTLIRGCAMMSGRLWTRQWP
jgi:hypothetical protein